MLALIATALLGWLAGLIVNYLSDVLPSKRKLSMPFCLQCQKRTNLSYTAGLQSCQICGHRRIIRTWIVEIVFLIASVWLWYVPSERLGYVVGLLLLIYFGVVVVIDIEHRLIMHVVSLTGIILGFGIGYWLHGLQATIIGGIFGFGLMLIVYFIGIAFVRVVTRLRDRDIGEGEALGFGDVSLSAVIGFILGWPGIVAGLIIAVILAGFVSLVYVVIMVAVRKYHPGLALPYGPFLVAGAVLLLYFGDALLQRTFY